MADLQHTLVRIRERLEQHFFPNEQSISQGIVLPVLQNLGWDVFRPDIVCPEYSTGKGRVDFALCSPPGKPRCFIEVKQPGTIGKKLDDAVVQLMNYAFHIGAQFVVLTDGRTWSFYLPAEPGSYEERRVFMLDLFEHEAGRASEVLTRYLLQKDVQSGETLARAKKDLHNATRRGKAKQEIPNAWKDLVRDRDSTIIDRLANECESKIGIRPENADVVTFLEKLTYNTQNIITSSPAKTPTRAQKVWPKEKASKNNSRESYYSLHGENHVCQNMKTAFVEIFTKLAQQDSQFLSRCANDSNFVGRTKRHLARSQNEVHPNRPDLAVAKLPDGWYINTHTSNAKKTKLLMSACSVAGIIFGKDLIIKIP